jgi:hypothetical protein
MHLHQAADKPVVSHAESRRAPGRRKKTIECESLKSLNSIKTSVTGLWLTQQT